MKTHLLLSIAAAAIALAIATPASFAAPQDTQQTTHVRVAKKKVVVHRKRHVVRRQDDAAYPALEPYRSSGFRGEFPGSCAYARANGNCMIDLGYGRCVPCEQGGGGGGRF
jgi:hypothetical protein